jgi:hypothetical protein
MAPPAHGLELRLAKRPAEKRHALSVPATQATGYGSPQRSFLYRS